MSERRKTIIRAERHDQPYFMLARSVAQNTKLSYEALGLLTYLLSKPGDWVVQPETLMRVKSGRDKVYRLLRELIEAGHIEKRAHRGEHQRIAGVEYIVYEIPRAVSPCTENPDTVKPDTEKPDTENKHITYDREEQSKERENAPLSADEIPDHVAPAMRPSLERKPQPDGGAKAYTLIEAYCDAWDVTLPKYRDQWHRAQQRGAESLANLDATPDEVKAMVAERRAKGKQPDECPMAYLANDYVAWKHRQSQPQLTVITLTPEQTAADAARREADRLQWWKEQGLA
jgi:hypothetical protein